MIWCVRLPLTIFSAAKCIVGQSQSMQGLLQMGLAAHITPHFLVRPPSISQPPPRPSSFLYLPTSPSTPADSFLGG